MKKFIILALILVFVIPHGSESAITEYYVTSDASGGGDGLSEPNAFTFDELSTRMAAGAAAAGDRYNIKSGTYSRGSTNDSWTNDGTQDSPIIIRGYKTTIGDMDPGATYDPKRTTMAGSLVDTNMPLLSYNTGNYGLSASGSENLIIMNLKVTGNRSSYMMIVSNYGVIFHCIAVNSSTNASAVGIQINTGAIGLDCDASVNGGSGGKAAFVLSTGSKLVSCKVLASSNYGVFITGTAMAIVAGCNISNCTVAGIYWGGLASYSPPFIYACTFYNNGIAYKGNADNFVYPVTIINSILTDSGGYAVDSTYYGTSNLSIVFANNRTRDNTSGTQRGFENWYAATNWGQVTTDTGGAETDYTNAASGDLTPIATSPSLASGVWGETIGAYQGGYPAVSSVAPGAYVNGVEGTAEGLDDPNLYVLKAHVVSNFFVLEGYDTYVGSPYEGTARLPDANNVWHTEQGWGIMPYEDGTMRASDIANCIPANIKDEVTIDDVLGELEIPDCNSLSVDPADVVDPKYVLTGHDNYVGGEPGTLTLPANGNNILDTETPFGVVGSLISGLYNGPEASEVWNAYTFGLNDGVSGTFHASDITVTNGDAATLTAPDILDGIVVDDVTGTASGSGMSSAWVGSNPQ